MAKKQLTDNYDAEFANTDELEELKDPELAEMGEEEGRGKTPEESDEDEEEAPETEEL
ncbi:MAG: hypothetical protein UV48_C0008G0023 [Candidatus Azambacteria bacterium GW2011_GWA2_42_9]|uniref:Uncharacterized protein n=3 Tax=Candidatus Azamiibacteriota TaxID=1752741 RepID=A0A0G0ZC27_9BACT|nr:MAG: hypothetical protein UV07_C0004G0005 [Candidatus Azambacteria bacterium GW2011_GWB1_42_17]KKS46290.1 MAG: hypothetical protein UV10_C0004G0005 [Candidatus Azambacteria bacterium GW2011_GWA1_42_19]KKS75683.1 MAG: hypothetical protein UV48_C0008G0023 [Candidatus Azambacteria bacterium GW2011_GWA2_42_9]KKS88554.1 MAG: hypothetical protein UV62_C0005G0008 [Parcubacteria group bacterium GW2011_GWC1_43_11]